MKFFSIKRKTRIDLSLYYGLRSDHIWYGIKKSPPLITEIGLFLFNWNIKTLYKYGFRNIIVCSYGVGYKNDFISHDSDIIIQERKKIFVSLI